MVTAFGLSPLLFLGLPLLVLAAAVFLYPRFDTVKILPAIESDQLAAYTIGVTATYLGALLAFGIAWFGTGIRAPLLAIGFGLLGAALGARFPATATTRKLVVGATGGLIAYAASNILIVTTSTTTIPSATGFTILGILAALPAILVLPLGYADTTGTRLSVAIRATIITAPLLLALLTIATETGTTAGTYPQLLGGYLLIVAIVGSVLYAVGARLAEGAVR